MPVFVFPHAAAAFAAATISTWLDAGELSVLGVATGSSPSPVYKELAQAGNPRLATLTAFALDKYSGLPLEHPQSYHSVITRKVAISPMVAVLAPWSTASWNLSLRQVQRMSWVLATRGSSRAHLRPPNSRGCCCNAYRSGPSRSRPMLVTAHLGTIGLSIDATAICGTGVAALASNGTGKWRRVDARGYMLGDFGGGFWIGQRGIQAALDALGGRGPQTSLAEVSGGSERLRRSITPVCPPHRLHGTWPTLPLPSWRAPRLLSSSRGASRPHGSLRVPSASPEGSCARVRWSQS